MRFVVIDPVFGATVYGIFDTLEEAEKERDYRNCPRHPRYQTVAIYENISEKVSVGDLTRT